MYSLWINNGAQTKQCRSLNNIQLSGQHRHIIYISKAIPVTGRGGL
jgi:hypothetical protein